MVGSGGEGRKSIARIGRLAGLLFSTGAAHAGSPVHGASNGPALGGFDALAYVSRAAATSGDAPRWRIEAGKLYLNANRFAKALWRASVPRRVLDTDGHWPETKIELEATR